MYEERMIEKGAPAQLQQAGRIGRGMVSLENPANRELEVPRLLESAHANSESVLSAIDMLEKRLSPILRDEPKTETRGPEPPPECGGTLIGQGVAEVTNRMCHAAYRLHRLVELLEV